MNVKKGICIIMLCFLFIGCCSTKPRADESIIEHSKQLAVLERGITEYGESVAEVRERLETVTTGLGEVREGAAGISRTVEDTIILFDEYQRAVEQLLRDYDRIRTATKTAYESHNGITSATGT